MWGYRTYLKSQTEEGMKEITVQVVENGVVVKEESFKTDALFVGQALDEIDLIGPGKYKENVSRFITIVNGKSAPDNTWWSLKVNGVLNWDYGMDDHPLKDKDVITISLVEIE